jgi:hypothetical protein
MTMAKRRDWIFRLVLACSGLALTAAFLFFILSLLQLLILRDNQLRIDFTKLPGLQGVDVVDLGLLLFFLALLLYVVAQQRAMTNIQLQYTSGCPACSEKKLVRVSRQTADRLLGISLIPMGRFVCPECRWEGRRIIRNAENFRQSPQPKTPMKSVSRIVVDETDALLEPDQQAPIPANGSQKMRPATELKSNHSSNGKDALAAAGCACQLMDQWSNHVITVHGAGSGKAKEQGGIVGSLRLLLWQESGSQTELQAYLEHSSTKVTLYDRIKVAEWMPKYSKRKDAKRA